MGQKKQASAMLKEENQVLFKHRAGKTIHDCSAVSVEVHGVSWQSL